LRCLWLDGSIIVPLHSFSPRGYQPRVSAYDIARSRFVCSHGVSAGLAYRFHGNAGNVLALLVIQFSKIKQICFCIPKGKNGASAGKNFSKSLEFFKITRISLDLSFLSAFKQQKCLYIPKGKNEACVRIKIL
jgi:hypothetical protein